MQDRAVQSLPAWGQRDGWIGRVEAVQGWIAAVSCGPFVMPAGQRVDQVQDVLRRRRPEDLGRLLRVIFTVGGRFLVLRRDRIPPPAQASGKSGWRDGAPILAPFQCGIVDHTLRDDLSANHLGQLFGGLVQPALIADLPRALCVEQTAAVIASMFLDGARRHL